MCQYLLDGQRISTIKSDLLAQTGQTNLDDALLNNTGALNLNLNVSSGFLLRVMRVGYPTMGAALFKYTGQPLVYPYLFLLLFWPTALLVAVLWFFFHHVAGSRYWMALGYALAIAMNCNLLNNACEGQHPQVFSAPYIGLFFIMLYLLRRSDDRQQLLLVAALGTIIAVMYTDAVLALGCVSAALVGIDWLLGQKTSLAADLRFGLATIVGLLATGPFMITWLPQLIKQACVVATGWPGFWQPYWASPAEIMGWIDIYSRPGFSLSHDLFPLHFTALVCSFPLLLLAFHFLFTVDRRELAYWLSPILFVAGIFVQTYIIHPIHNYAYMKAYTILFFPLCTMFFVAMERHLARQTGSAHRQIFGLLLVAIFGSIFTGSVYLVRYAFTAEKLPADINELQDLNRRIDFSKVAIVTPHHFDLRGSILYTSVGMFIPFNWLNCQDSDTYLVPHSGMSIFILAMKSEIPSDRLAVLAQDPHLVFQNNGFLLLDTGTKITAPANQLQGTYKVVVPTERGFRHGESDDQQYDWNRVLNRFGL